jgi:hypothetical protein
MHWSALRDFRKEAMREETRVVQASVYSVIESNWRIIAQALAARNVLRPELEAMRDAYIECSLARHNEQLNVTAIQVEYFVANGLERAAVKALQDRGYTIYKNHCGIAVVK